MTIRRLSFSAILITSACLIAACDSGTAMVQPPPVDPNLLAGSYEGFSFFSSQPFGLIVSIVEDDDGVLSGTGAISYGDNDPLPANTFEGTHDHPDVEFTLTFSDGREAQYIGTVENGGERFFGQFPPVVGDTVLVTMERPMPN